MTIRFSRRGFLAASAACAALPAIARAQAPVPMLRAETRVIDVDGRAASVFGLRNDADRQGIVLDPGQRFRLRLANDLAEPTIIHWHGQIPPNAQDGVPGAPMAPLQPGETRDYDFAPLPGSFWMHSHIPVQEMRLLAAPLIVRSAEDSGKDRQEVVMFLHDFSHKTPEEVLSAISGGHGAPRAMDHGSGHGAAPMAMDHGSGEMGGMMAMPDGMAMDLNDYEFDAYLANDRTLGDPDIVPVEKGGRVLLRVINAAAATNFWIDAGGLPARLVAVDGHGVQLLTRPMFGLSMGQRLDIELDLPAGGGAFPVLALREGAVQRTGLVLASAGAPVARIAPEGATPTPAFDTDLAQEGALRALSSLPDRPVAQRRMLMLAGSMSPYLWTVDGQVWGQHVPVEARHGERVELTFHNMSMMGHPMHLHGHVFQVVELNGRRMAGALRDTVYVPPMARVTVALDAGEAARWMLHCHHMPHLASGMMTEFVVSA